MKISYLFLCSVITLMLFSCSSSIENNNTTNEIEKYTPLKNEDKFEKFVADIDLNESLIEVGSLYYTKEDKSDYEVSAFLDQNKKIVKMQEKYVDGKSGQYGTNVFYFVKGIKVVSKERFEDHSDVKPKFIERISYYDNSGNVLSSKMRSANFEEELDQSIYVKCKSINCTTKNAEDALNQRGSFITTFQGFVENGRQLFLTIGENKPDGYVSALLVQTTDDNNIKKLRDSEILMIGKQLTVNFERMTDASGFQFQVLTGIKFVGEEY